jgi:poly(hydroxyalkanoate) depolymerase family esterase
MKFDLARIMREATNMTRAQKLIDATKLIQGALATGPRENQSDPAPEREGVIEDHGDDRQTDFNRLREEVPEAFRTWNGKQRRPLARTIEALRQGKFDGLSPIPKTIRGARPVADIPVGALFLSRTFSGATGSRAYKVYLPGNVAARLPLLVMLHGCTQNADDFAIGTRMNSLAEEFGFLVAYPEQSRAANPSLCWNWFRPNDTRRGSGEAAILAGITQEVVAEYSVDPARVFVAGMSAGGAMADAMGHTYPDIFAGVGIHSGLPHGSAVDAVSAFAAMRGEPTTRNPTTFSRSGNPVPAIIFHGDADHTVNPSNGGRIFAAYSEAGRSTKTATGMASGRAYTCTTVAGDDGSSVAEHWILRGASHAWSGGNTEGTFTDESGPDASREIVRFFLSSVSQ